VSATIVRNLISKFHTDQDKIGDPLKVSF